MTLDGKPHTVVGVMPPGFAYPKGATYWVPVAPAGGGPLLENRNVFWMIGLGRLRSNSDLETARSELTGIWQQMHQTVFQARQLPFDGHPVVRRHLWLDSCRDVRSSRRRAARSVDGLCECRWTAAGARRETTAGHRRSTGTGRNPKALGGRGACRDVAAGARRWSCRSGPRCCGHTVDRRLVPGRRASARIRRDEQPRVCVCRRRLPARRVCVSTRAHVAHRSPVARRYLRAVPLNG